MAGLATLLALAGDWRATYELRGDPSFECDTTSHATITPVLGGRFVRIDYTWDEEDRLQEHGPQEGSLLVGFEPAADGADGADGADAADEADGADAAEASPGVATVVMIDSWHLHDGSMVSRGKRLDDGGVDVFGTWSVGGDSPDWGWRTILAPSDDGWTMTMFVVTPDGKESPAVSAAYRRSTA